MDMASITVRREGAPDFIFSVRRGENLFDALAANVGGLPGDCGGRGICGKCGVKITAGAPEPAVMDDMGFSEEELTQGWRLSCLHEVQADMDVEMRPVGGMSVVTEGELPPFERDPGVHVMRVEPRQGTIERQTDDEAALKDALGFDAEVALPVLRGLPALLRGCDWKIDAAICGDRVIDAAPCGSIKPAGLAVDIGTTTVVGYFYDLVSMQRIFVASGQNRQAQFGADVISRITHCMESKDGLGDLKEAVTGQLNAMIAEFCAGTGRAARDIMYIAIAGNTTMQHMAAGISPDSIANAPFIAGTLFGSEYLAADIMLDAHPLAPVFMLPCVSGYVGGDITAAVLASQMHSADGLHLLIDIGTNGEIVLGGRDGMSCCATAAGPAFEGATIKCGVGGVTGAINRVRLTGGEVCCETIGNAAAVGICGSGLIDAMAVMLELGALDETGRLLDKDEAEEAAAPYLDEKDGQNIFWLDKGAGVYITAKDAREVQLGKAAIAAGVDTMLHYAGKTPDELDAIYIAGGFGAYICRESAVAIGLLPDLAQRIKPIGNAAGSGAAMALLSRGLRGETMAVRDAMRYIELSGDAHFQDAYVDRMMFEKY